MDTDEEVEIITDKEIKCEIEEDRSRRHHLDGNMDLIGSKKRQCTSSLMNIYNAKGAGPNFIEVSIKAVLKIIIV